MGDLVRLDIEVNDGSWGDDRHWKPGTVLRNTTTGETMSVASVEWGTRPKATAHVRVWLEREGWDIPPEAA
jgi:hypothetical protein